MANSLITPSIIAKEALMQLKNNLVMGNLVYRDYSKEFVKVGSSISVRKPVRFVASSGATRVNQDVTEGTVPVLMDQQKHVSWKFSSVDLTLTVDQYSERYIKPAMMELAQAVEISLCGLYSTVPNHVGTPGTTPSTFLQVGAAWQRLIDNRVPMGSTLNAVIETNATLQIANDMKLQFQQAKQLRAIEDVMIGRYAKFDTYTGQSIVNHTTGIMPSGFATFLVNGANQHSNATPQANSQSMICSGGTASQTGWLKAGDIITFAGVLAVNAGTRQNYTYSKQFVVTADANTDGAGASTITISPAIISTGPYQNVSAVPASGAVITRVTGTAVTGFPQNMCFHKNAFALVSADLELPDGVPFKARESYDNLSVRVVKSYNIDNDEDVIRLDILYGVKTIYPELAVRLTG